MHTYKDNKMYQVIYNNNLSYKLKQARKYTWILNIIMFKIIYKQEHLHLESPVLSIFNIRTIGYFKVKLNDY